MHSCWDRTAIGVSHTLVGGPSRICRESVLVRKELKFPGFHQGSCPCTLLAPGFPEAEDDWRASRAHSIRRPSCRLPLTGAAPPRGSSGGRGDLHFCRLRFWLVSQHPASLSHLVRSPAAARQHFAGAPCSSPSLHIPKLLVHWLPEKDQRGAHWGEVKQLQEFANFLKCLAVAPGDFSRNFKCLKMRNSD